TLQVDYLVSNDTSCAGAICTAAAIMKRLRQMKRLAHSPRPVASDAHPLAPPSMHWAQIALWGSPRSFGKLVRMRAAYRSPTLLAPQLPNARSARRCSHPGSSFQTLGQQWWAVAAVAPEPWPGAFGPGLVEG